MNEHFSSLYQPTTERYEPRHNSRKSSGASITDPITFDEDLPAPARLHTLRSRLTAVEIVDLTEDSPSPLNHLSELSFVQPSGPNFLSSLPEVISKPTSSVKSSASSIPSERVKCDQRSTIASMKSSPDLRTIVQQSSGALIQASHKSISKKRKMSFVPSRDSTLGDMGIPSRQIYPGRVSSRTEDEQPYECLAAQTSPESPSLQRARNAPAPQNPPSNPSTFPFDTRPKKYEGRELREKPGRHVPVIIKSQCLTQFAEHGLAFEPIIDDAQITEEQHQQQNPPPLGKEGRFPCDIRLSQAETTSNCMNSVKWKSVDPASKDNLKESLLLFNQQMKNDHALTVRWALKDAKEKIHSAPQLFKDHISPFAGVKGVQMGTGEASTVGVTTKKLESYVLTKTSSKAKITKSHSLLIVKSIKDNLPRVPKYSSHTEVARNHLTADDEQLRYLPFLGDLFPGSSKRMNYHTRLVKELEEAFSATKVVSTRETERASRLRGYLEYWLDELSIDCSEEVLIRHLVDEEDEGFGKKKSDMIGILKDFGGPLPGDLKILAQNFTEAFELVFEVDLKDVILPESRLKEMVESRNLSPQKSHSDRLDTFADLNCLICGTIACQTHGDYNRFPLHPSSSSESGDNNENEAAKWEYKQQPVTWEYKSYLRKHDARVSAKDGEFDYKNQTKHSRPCSAECHLRARYSCMKYDHWNEDEINSLEQSLISVVNKSRNVCGISFAINRPCWQVYNEIQNYEERGGRKMVESTSKVHPKRPDWYDNKRKVTKGDLNEITTQHLHQKRFQVKPCAHDGPCSVADCECAESNLLCEDICECSDDCPRKFTGCACGSSGTSCLTDSCICVQMNRECGPPCGSCGAIQRINPANREDDELFATGCQNVWLQRNMPKCLITGESQLEGVGFGLYLGESVQKGEFLSEYSGEVISYNEAERRGIIYDRKYMSFLFDLNSEWVVDAARLGNKTRFINHAETEKDGLNCEARIVLVNGEHRIKFIALRDIKVGEELLFNYGKKFAEKHGLSKKLPKAKEGGKRGVLEGSEALDALDGVERRGRGPGRMRLTAIKSGKRSGAEHDKEQKSQESVTSNVSVIRDPLLAAMQQVVASQDGEFIASTPDDGDDDEDPHIRRRKRRITRPARYTR